jgi:hypothetical protein
MEAHSKRQNGMGWHHKGGKSTAGAVKPERNIYIVFSNAGCVSFTDVQCMVSSQVPYTLEAFWGVSIRELHLSLWRPWSVLEKQMQQGTVLQGHYQHKETILQYPLLCLQFTLLGEHNFNLYTYYLEHIHI